MPRAAKWTEGQIAVATDLLRKGERYATIAGLVGRTRSAVRNFARMRNIETYKSCARRLNSDRAVRMRRRGISINQIAKTLRVATRTVLALIAARDPALCAPLPRYRPDPNVMSRRRYDAEHAESMIEDWPPVTRRARRYLEGLERIGPATLVALAATVDRHFQCTKTAMRQLLMSGYVVREKVCSGRIGGSAFFYDLAPTVRKARRTYLRLRGMLVPPPKDNYELASHGLAAAQKPTAAPRGSSDRAGDPDSARVAGPREDC